MVRKILVASLFLILCSGSASVKADIVQEYANTVLAFSSQWSATLWSANQVLGPPDTFGYGDISTAWAPGYQNWTLEYVSVSFVTPVYAFGAVIRETSGNGFVYQIDAIDLANNYHTVWSGTDPSLPGAPVDFSVSWSQTSYLVSGIKVYVDTSHTLSWEETDSIRLDGDTEPRPIPEPASLMLLATGLLGLAGIVRRKNE